MMSSDFYFRDKIPVAVLGATSLAGQMIIQLLSNHPWFEIIALCDSESFVGHLYGDSVNWLLSSPIAQFIAKMPIHTCEPTLQCSLVFSALSSKEAIVREKEFAQAGFHVISCYPHSENHHIPFIVAKVNRDHLELMEEQPYAKGRIVANPMPVVIGLTLALKPLMDEFGLEAVQVVTLHPYSKKENQKTYSHIDRVLSFFKGEETRIEHESLKILGQLRNGIIQQAHFKISAQSHHIAKIEEDLACVSVKLHDKADPKRLIQAWHQFNEASQKVRLPNSIFQDLHDFDLSKNVPSLEHLRGKEKGIWIANLRPCSVLDYKFTLLSSPSRLMAGSALLNAELLVIAGKIYW
jgi:aspartate-semialdehyde dehydrogenase